MGKKHKKVNTKPILIKRHVDPQYIDKLRNWALSLSPIVECSPIEHNQLNQHPEEEVKEEIKEEIKEPEPYPEEIKEPDSPDLGLPESFVAPKVRQPCPEEIKEEVKEEIKYPTLPPKPSPKGLWQRIKSFFN